MVKRRSQPRDGFKTVCFGLLFLVMAGVIAYTTGVVGSADTSTGLSGLVSVKGSVSLDALNLSKGEVTRINRVVAEHRSMFSQVDLFLDTKESGPIDDKTVLVMAMVLETDGECEVRSWSRKVVRADLVPQMVRYMVRAADEYEKFKRYPDVQQNFKCLYI